MFNATFDTTGATVGTYTVKADDGDGHTDTVTVEILAVAPTPTPTPTPTTTPTATPTATATPAPTPPAPGFEAVFTNFFASQKPLLKVLRYCRLAHNRIPRAEETEVRVERKRVEKVFWGKVFYLLFIIFY